jgi:DNA-binding protein HU-beta
MARHKNVTTYTKAQLSAGIAEEVGITKTQAREAVDLLLGYIHGALAEGNKVSLAGFGSFSIRHKPATRARTMVMFGEERRVPAKPASRKIVFRPAKAVKESV